MQVKFFNNWKGYSSSVDIFTIGVARTWYGPYRYTFAFAIMNLGFGIRFWRQGPSSEIPF